MEPRKLKLFVANFAYGGNGGVSMESPNIRKWFVETVLWAKTDPRIGGFDSGTFSDTPITMTRNAAVLAARKAGADVLILCDSDQHPHLHADLPDFKPFVQSSFDFLYERWDRGPTAICAPYRGNPPQENMFVFRFEPITGDYGDETRYRLDQYTRQEAAKMRGIQECGAGPTGLIMIDMRLFPLIEPVRMSKREILVQVQSGKMTVSDAERNLSEGWFYYQWKDGYATEKASTEDVTFTRDVSLAGQLKYGYNPLFCNWDSPIGHWKPYCVPGRPSLLVTQEIAENFKRAVDRDGDEVHVDASQFLKGWDKIIERQTALPAPSNHNGNGKPYVHKNPDSHLQALKNLVKSEYLRLPVRDNGSRRPLDVCEVGTWHGDSAKAMASAANCYIECVDHWQGSDELVEAAKAHSPLDAFLKNCMDEIDEGRISYFTGDSLAAAQQFTLDARYFDIIILDADHSYQATKDNIVAYLPLVRDGGLLVVHDYLSATFPGVTDAVHEILGDKAKPYAWSKDVGGYCIFRKEAATCPI